MSSAAAAAADLFSSKEFSLASEERFASTVDSIAAALTASGGRGQLSKWIPENTSHPHNPLLPWSFVDHEYQLGILECEHPTVSVKKAAQVGVSELSVRTALAMSQLAGIVNIIYVLPTTSFARRFAVSRIDTVIQASKRLREMIDRDVNNNEMKKLGNSFLFIGGAQKASQAISIPATVLIRDEYDFGDQATLTSYQSRLSHCKPGEASTWNFSTPTSPGFGISTLYSAGTQNVYLCFHSVCGKWTVIDPLQDLVVPGFDDHLTDLVVQDLSNPRIQLDRAHIRCQQCHHPISQENMAHPTTRTWVARFPEREDASFYVSPMDVAAINTPAKLLKAREQYKTTSDWVNFSFGQEYESSENSILDSVLSTAFSTQKVEPSGRTGVYGACLGMDMGKVAHLLVGKRVDGELHVLWAETIRQTMEDKLTSTYVERHNQYGALQGVVDAAPDVTVPGRIRLALPYNQAWGSYFVRGKGKADLELYELKEGQGVVNISRTRMFDEMVKEFNAGRIKFARGLEMEEEIKQHLKAVKRVTPQTFGDTGDTAFWTSNGAAHWFLALIYLFTAARLLADDTKIVVMPSPESLIRKVRLDRG